ncbi:MAG TPA: cupin domain-containing protein [Solirubrobacteraceae bacterium]|nr:cupin domain-containing protein [Solirubrobacteraceae bacterium]
MVNFLHPEWDAERDQDGFRWRRAFLARKAGARKLGASLFSVPPGGATFPLHAHLHNEELLLVLAGRPTLLGRDDERELAEGEVVAFPAGPSGAHRIENRTDGEVRLVLVSTMLAPEVNLMLEDGTAWVRDYVPGTEPSPGAVDFRMPVDGLG